MSKRRSRSLEVSAVLCEDVIKPGVCIHWHSTRESDGGNGGNRGKLVLNLLLHARDAGIVRYIGIRNCNAKRLKLGWTHEPWINVRQNTKGPNHQPCENQQDDGKRNLRGNKKVACAMPFAAQAKHASAFEN